MPALSSAPDFVVRIADRTPGGSLTIRSLQMIEETLKAGGLVVLPSDTAYSVAALPASREVRDRINRLLDRPRDLPISLAFPSMSSVFRWTLQDLVLERLLERFCPGPITIVTRARSELPAGFFDTIVVPDQTIGVRIPDSSIERDVARLTALPVTTAAIREPAGSPVRSLDSALNVVRSRMGMIAVRPWCAVEGSITYDSHSTVVRYSGGRRGLTEIRPGAIPFSEIQESIGDLPASAFEGRDR